MKENPELRYNLFHRICLDRTIFLLKKDIFAIKIIICLMN